MHRLSSEIKDLSSTLKSLHQKHGQFYNDILDTSLSQDPSAFQRFDNFLSEAVNKVDAWQNLLEESTRRAETATALLFNRLTAILSISSRQDTTSMKIIAFFTMIYLAGSFVSSIFGWSIISFSVDEATNRQSVVVGEQWKWYVAITVSLTVATFVAFWLFQATDPEKEHKSKVGQGSLNGNVVIKRFRALFDWKLPWTKSAKRDVTAEEIDRILQRVMP
jgi:Mg2+ and Co2+ transporter CorA